MRRAFDPDELELMDRPHPVSAELEEDLENLRKLNRWFGSHRLVKHFASRWLKNGDRLLDLATGSGDIPRLIVDLARERGLAVQIDAVDAHPATLEIARKQSADYPEIRFIQSDAREYSAGATYDVVCCSLALHHFSNEDATLLLRRCRELSHACVLVADLERSEWCKWGIYLLTSTLFRQRMTKFDARLSIRRAFSFTEFRELAEAAGWVDFNHARFPVGRQAVWIEETIAPVVDPLLVLSPASA